jgi:hypothetical protein
MADFLLALYTGSFKSHPDDERGDEVYEVWRCERR